MTATSETLSPRSRRKARKTHRDNYEAAFTDERESMSKKKEFRQHFELNCDFIAQIGADKNPESQGKLARIRPSRERLS
jgi:hypothetical protein